MSLNFFKRGDFKVSYLKFESGKSPGRKSFFVQLPWDTQNFQEFQTFVCINFVLLISFPEQFGLCFYFKYARSYTAL